MWTTSNCIVWVSLSTLLYAAYIKGELQCPLGLNSPVEVTTVKTFRDKCYQFIHVEKYWHNARDYCWKNGGSLFSIPNRDVNNFITSSLNALPWSNNGVWTGLNDRNDELKFYWVTAIKQIHTAVSWSNWASGHPGAVFSNYRDCVHMDRNGGRWTWHETPCQALQWHYRFICEYDMILKPTHEVSINEHHVGSRAGESQKKSTDVTTLHKSSTYNTENHAANGKFTLHVHDHTETTSIKPLITNLVKQHLTLKELPISSTNTESVTSSRNTPAYPWVKVAAAQDGSVGGSTDSKVSIVAVVIAFIAGIICALVIVLVVVFRRRKRAQSNVPNNLSNPVYSQITMAVDDADGAVCGTPCEESCASKCCIESDNNTSTPPVPEVTGTASRRDKRMIRQPAEPNIYSESDNPSGQPALNQSQGNNVVLADNTNAYLPMSSNVPIRYNRKDQSELPPIPGDGYEVPRESTNEYSVIPELSPDSENEENVYATIDEVKKFSR